MKARSGWLLLGVGSAILMVVVAALPFIPWRSVLTAPVSSHGKSVQDSTVTRAYDSSRLDAKVDDKLLEDAFGGKSEPTAGGESAILRIGDIPLSKMHPAAAAEFEVGNVMAEKGKWQIAHGHYINCIQTIIKDEKTRRCSLDPNWLSVCYGVIAVCLAEQNKYDVAMDHLKEAMNLDPAIAENYAVRGNLYLLRYKEEQAKADFQRASGKSVLKCFPRWAQKLEWCKVPLS